MIVVDASVLVPGLVDDGRDGDAARVRLRGEVLAAPELVDLEVASVLRRLVLAGSLPLRHADLALADLVELPLQRAAHRSLLARCWQLRSNVTVYDAAYIALAEALGALLVTADARLAAAPGLRCDVELLTA
ncbi:MAG: type II toxin-antitoxin system VapC family toxin [Actinomycetota bacterium]|nr:type II toxin-antitoxin system VapC family toxin [Actinomycetota bacterium]MDP9461158.1 type II toxin-antitoxin system VapC family toxin [Actinomycetota bacterium]